MIRIIRPTAAPAVLRNSTRRAEHERDYLASPADYDSGKQSFTFDDKVYGHESVKSALVTMQNEKCAFCESKPLAVSSGDVEHFRPKARARSTAGGPLEYPGYYWLAYEWENLVFACERCNRREKASQFPLAAPRTETRTHTSGISGEQPLFVDPASEDPAPHVAFRRHVPYGLTPRGTETIRGLGLTRHDLAKDREDHLNALFDRFLIAECLPDMDPSVKARAVANLALDLSDGGEYAAMKRTAVEVWRKRRANGQPLEEP